MEESEVCSLPGGLASVRNHFESQGTASSSSSSHNVTQVHFHHRTVQEVSNTEVTVMGGARHVLPGSQQPDVHQEDVVGRVLPQRVTVVSITHSANHMESSYDNHHGTEDFPRFTTKELRDHFEKTIEEAAPSKQMKIGRDINRSKWSSHVAQKAVVEEVNQVSAREELQREQPHSSVSFVDYEEDFPPPPPEDLDYLPPPPPDLLQDPEDDPECYHSPEPQPAISSKQPLNREAYFKQRNMYELKRLYKHINPEVRKNIEREYFSDSEIQNNQLESQDHMYEQELSGSPEEYIEWDEVGQGEVQSRRWMFENKPLDTIKDETLDEDYDNRRISQHEMIVGKDVRHTAWMFETKPMDELGSNDADSTEVRNKCNMLDKGDVRAAAWLFETQPMESLNKMHGGEDLTKEIVFTEEDGNATIYMIDNKYMETLGHTETIDERHLLSLRTVLEEINGEVKMVTSTFDTQFKCVIVGQSSQMLEIKSVRKVETELECSIASRWLFDTQLLDLGDEVSTPLKLVCSLSMEDSSKGDWGRWLFEIKTINSLEDWESSHLQKEEIIGADVRKHCMVFETQPMDSLKDDSNARVQTIEDVIGGNVRSARNFFESSPQIARKNSLEVGKLKATSKNEVEKGDVRHQKWRFESQPLELIREDHKEVIRTVNIEEDLTQENGSSCKADVRKNCWVFETQPMDTLKDDANSRLLSKEEIISGNVQSARHYFETKPAEELKDLADVGRLKNNIALEEERGDVRHQKWRFESQPLENIREEKKEVIRTIDLEEIDKVDVSNYKEIFETTDLSRKDDSQKIHIEGVTSGSVKSNTHLFESTQLYAMQDSSGHYHEVRTVRREEVVKGDVTTCKWMFETRPIDQFDEIISKYQVIKGISKQEVESGDVKTAKWLFETQPLDGIKYFSNIEEDETVDTSKHIEIVKGDVKTCKWLFETKPMDCLYDRVHLKSKDESLEVKRGDVKTCTWLFETQALDAIRDENETVLQTRPASEDVQGKDVKMVRFLFETENLEELTGKDRCSFKQVTEINIESGDVSRKKYIFENQMQDIMTSTTKETMQKLKSLQSEDIQKGNVVNCKWLFENHSEDKEEFISSHIVDDVQGGNVDKGRFIFETYSLDKIQEVSSDTEITKLQTIIREDAERGDVRNYTMMFETQPLYAIQDREGHYHEVTTVTSEEVMRGDVVGSRWLFETKPLDSIRDTDEVYVIKSVTQEDAHKGDVTSARWKFETQPLDEIAAEKVLIKTVEDIRGGDVRMNKQRFECDALSQSSVQTVNVSEIQKGDVRTAKWRFETQSIDKIKSMSAEDLLETVQKEEIARGDVKQSVWLFEKNPLDHIREVDEGAATVTQEDIPKADVKSTTWLFETTPFNNFNETNVEKTEILGKSIKRTLEELYSEQMVSSKGVIIEADEIGDVRMAKYQLMNKNTPEIQREQVIKGDLESIMMKLLNRQETNDRQVTIDSEEKGNISSTVHQLLNQVSESSVEKEEILRGDIQEAVKNLFRDAGSSKHGILIQEDEKGDVRMTMYSLLNKEDNITLEKEGVIRGDIKNALQKLSSNSSKDPTVVIKVDDTEKGNVHFYSTCIESGTVDSLKQLHLQTHESEAETVEKEAIIGGDIKSTKRILCQNQAEIGRTVEDIVPGDVHNTVKVFMSEPSIVLECVKKEEIVKGDLKAALSSLSDSVNQSVVVEKEEVVKGNIPKALRCLERAQKHYREVEKPDIIRGNIKGALKSLEKSATSKIEAVMEDLVPGDVKATLKSLEQAKQAVREVEKEEIIRGDIHTMMQCLQDASNDRWTSQQEIEVQGDVKGTIQLLLESPSSPRMQRRASLEGDVKMSIKSLSEDHEQTQLEKEEVIKGDVKGTIKSLLETAQRETPKVHRKVRVKRSHLIKKPNIDRNLQKIKTASQDNCTTSTEAQVETTHCSIQQSCQNTTVVEHKTITQNHGIKTLKTEFRNLNRNPKGTIKMSKTKVKQSDVHIPKPSLPEPDLPLPPPPPPVSESDLPPPPSPPCSPSGDPELDQLPPPPPPISNDQDVLPPPPSQQELDSMPSQVKHPSPAKPKKMTVRKVKAPILCPVPKLEPKVDIDTTQQVTQRTTTTTNNTSVVDGFQTESKLSTKHVLCEIPPPPVSPRPLKKVYIPVRLTPPPSPPPSMRGKMTKFNTPLIKAEEKFRMSKEDSTPPTTPTPTYIHECVTAALEMLSSQDNISDSTDDISDHAEDKGAKTVTTIQSDSIVADVSKCIGITDCRVASIQQTFSNVTAVKQQTLSSTERAISGFSQSSQSIMTNQIQTSNADVKKIEMKCSGTVVKKEDVTLEDTKSSKSQESESKKKKGKESKIPDKDKNTMVAKTSQSNSEKKHNESIFQEEVSDYPVKTAKTSNGKTGKLSQKAKKNNKQEKQTRETKKADEIEKTSGAQVNDLKAKLKEPVEVKLKEHVEVKMKEHVEVKLKEPVEVNFKEHVEVKLKEPVEVKVKEPVEVKVKEPVDVKVKDPVEVKVKEPAEEPAKVKEPVKKPAKVKEPANLKEPEKKPAKVKEPDEVKVKESAEVKVKEPAEVKVKKPVEVKVKEPAKVKVKEPDEVKVKETDEVKVKETDEVKMKETDEVKVKEPADVTASGKQNEVKMDVKEDVLQVTSSPSATGAATTVAMVTINATQNQLASSSGTKKKKKAKKSKVAAQSGQSKETESPEETMTVTSMCEDVSGRGNTDVHKEVVITESLVKQNVCEETFTVEKQVKTQVLSSIKQKTKESRAVPITMTSNSESNSLFQCTTKTTNDSQRQEVQSLISEIAELRRVSGKIQAKSVKTLLNTIPVWILSEEEKCDLELSAIQNNVEKLEEIVLHLQKLSEDKLSFLDGNYTVEKHECESICEKVVPSRATQRISKISIGSTKVESETKQNKSHESRKQDVSQGRLCVRAPSPSLRTRPPSPTFITIESTRRTDSPQRVTPSPTPLHRPATPPTPPCRRSDTPTSRITRITPSPTFDRVESLARLKDTTAKLSRVVTPPLVLQHQQVVEKRSEIVESPASFHRQIRLEPQTMEVSEPLDRKAECKNENKVGKEQEKPVDDPPKADVNPVNIEMSESRPGSTLEIDLSLQDIEQDSVPTSEQVVLSVKDKKELFEEAQKAEINKTYVRKNPIDIPERLGPEVEDSDMGHEEKEVDEHPRVDLSGLVNRFEIPEGRVYARKDPITRLEHPKNETEVNKTESIDILEQERPVFDIQAIKDVFKLDEHKAEQSHQELAVLNPTTDRPRSRNHRRSESSRQKTPVPSLVDVVRSESSEPTVFSESCITTEHFSNVQHLGTKTVKSGLSESVSDTKAPFSYADVVKRKVAKRTESYDEASTEELLRNFHKTWTESETVFKSLGYCVTEEKTSQLMTQQTESSRAGKLLSSMGKKTTNGMD